MIHGMPHIMAHAMSPAMSSAMTQIYFAAWQTYGSAHGPNMGALMKARSVANLRLASTRKPRELNHTGLIVE
jgi:hypothetical protein